MAKSLQSIFIGIWTPATELIISDVGIVNVSLVVRCGCIKHRIISIYLVGGSTPNPKKFLLMVRSIFMVKMANNVVQIAELAVIRRVATFTGM